MRIPSKPGPSKAADHYMEEACLLEVQVVALGLMRKPNTTARQVFDEVGRAFPEVPQDVRSAALYQLVDQMLRNGG